MARFSVIAARRVTSWLFSDRALQTGLWGYKRENIGLVCGCAIRSGEKPRARGTRGWGKGGETQFFGDSCKLSIYHRFTPPVLLRFVHRKSTVSTDLLHDCRTPIISARLLAPFAIGCNREQCLQAHSAPRRQPNTGAGHRCTSLGVWATVECSQARLRQIHYVCTSKETRQVPVDLCKFKVRVMWRARKRWIGQSDDFLEVQLSKSIFFNFDSSICVPKSPLYATLTAQNKPLYSIGQCRRATNTGV